MGRPDLVFVTEANKAQLTAQAEKMGKTLPEDKLKELNQTWKCECGHIETLSLVHCMKCNKPKPEADATPKEVV